MSLISALFGSPQPAAGVVHDNSLTKLFGVNNAPVSSFCNSIPVLQPSLISTPFGVSLITLSIFSIYLVMYLRSPSKTGIETRLLTALMLGNVAYSALAFEDWFNLHYQIVLCNDYKNGMVNLYEVSQMIENYKLDKLVRSHLLFYTKIFSTYSILVFKQFSHVTSELARASYSFVVEGTQEAWSVGSQWVKAKA